MVVVPHASSTVVIDRPIAEVFAFLADAENDLRWRSGIREMSHAGGGPGVGTRYRQRVAGPAGRSIPADIEVTAFDPPTRLAFAGTAGPVRPVGEYRLTERDGGTEVVFTIAAELGALPRLLMGRRIQETMTSEVGALRTLKTVLEHPTAP
jgi:uncharacterized protein YndB with AHSA1/START domain